MISVAPGFWAGWVAVITFVSAVGLVWLVVGVYSARDDSEEVAAHVWDETLREGTARAPLWWFWLILALLAFSVVYLILYPGLGAYAGALNWSQGGRLADSTARYEARFGAERERVASAAVADLAADDTAMRSAWHVFNVNCSACHGRDARGQAELFPNLRDADWQWGGDEAQIAQTISAGRQAVMPPWQPVLGEDGVEKMADYVLGLSSGAAPDDAATATQFATYCAACHGPDGRGQPALGAPALNDGVWLYGGSRAAVRASIAGGRNGAMPAFGARLDAAEIKLLTAWLASGAQPRE